MSPLPRPRANDNEREFIDRCMTDETMEEEYEDREQRAAVCFDLWERWGYGDDGGEES